MSTKNVNRYIDSELAGRPPYSTDLAPSDYRLFSKQDNDLC